ncbi:hypothetical protein BHE74_00013637 [Ensete ventricosum]|uniref:Uncharacterized protein n=1 Tax=Ensete ventricosum TaxID=4639 RepID=A0A426ZSA6_ENSVE|nr:hypothetical protein B296_00030037 [Ensete ventricosum]RWW28784.1 hypothetical protein GW17_00006719 [Ensete ventricosum]RWW78159.1 hypothetical protein BHE74_00013637 [Ensete ventricosum]RZS02369.1 hypothetical protein BHM03_00032412 [Ensete ventricosum]
MWSNANRTGRIEPITNCNRCHKSGISFRRFPNCRRFVRRGRGSRSTAAASPAKNLNLSPLSGSLGTYRNPSVPPRFRFFS